MSHPGMAQYQFVSYLGGSRVALRRNPVRVYRPAEVPERFRATPRFVRAIQLRSVTASVRENSVTMIHPDYQY